MKVGLQIYRWDWPGTPENTGPKMKEIAKTAEQAGFSSLWVMDHWFQLGTVFGPESAFGPPEAPVLEGYSTISYLAAVTERVKVGLMVTGNSFRHPGVLIKTVSTLDVLSGGRTYLGIGTGGLILQEVLGLGLPLYSRQELIGRLEETLQIARKMWTGDTTPYEGAYYQLAEPINSPQPLSQPHPPILIGLYIGGKRMLQLVARYGDAINLQFGSPLKDFPAVLRERYQNRKEYFKSKLKLLRRYCREFGRSYDEIERTVLGQIKLAPDAMSTTEVIGLCRELADLGFQHVIFSMSDSHEISPLEIFGEEIIPTVTEFREEN